jgi:hypothetical protein
MADIPTKVSLLELPLQLIELLLAGRLGQSNESFKVRRASHVHFNFQELSHTTIEVKTLLSICCSSSM